jgi:hypothetical protein
MYLSSTTLQPPSPHMLTEYPFKLYELATHTAGCMAGLCVPPLRRCATNLPLPSCHNIVSVHSRHLASHVPPSPVLSLAITGANRISSLSSIVVHHHTAPQAVYAACPANVSVTPVFCGPANAFLCSYAVFPCGETVAARQCSLHCSIAV